MDTKGNEFKSLFLHGNFSQDLVDGRAFEYAAQVQSMKPADPAKATRGNYVGGDGSPRLVIVDQRMDTMRPNSGFIGMQALQA